MTIKISDKFVRSWQGVGLSSNPDLVREPISHQMLAYLICGSGCSESHEVVIGDDLQTHNYASRNKIPHRKALRLAKKKGRIKSRQVRGVCDALGLDNVSIVPCSKMRKSLSGIIAEVREVYDSDSEIQAAVNEAIARMARDSQDGSEEHYTFRHSSDDLNFTAMLRDDPHVDRVGLDLGFGDFRINAGLIRDDSCGDSGRLLVEARNDDYLLGLIGQSVALGDERSNVLAGRAGIDLRDNLRVEAMADTKGSFSGAGIAYLNPEKTSVFAAGGRKMTTEDGSDPWEMNVSYSQRLPDGLGINGYSIAGHLRFGSDSFRDFRLRFGDKQNLSGKAGIFDTADQDFNDITDAPERVTDQTFPFTIGRFDDFDVRDHMSGNAGSVGLDFRVKDANGFSLRRAQVGVGLGS